LVSPKLYSIIGIVTGFVLIDYGFNFVAIGLPGAREMTSSFIGANLLIGGSAAVFVALFYLLKPAGVKAPPQSSPATSVADVGVELVVEEETPPQFKFYKNIEYVGYVFTALGLFSAADLMLQVFISKLYNEARWWVEILLVVFGVLAYAIFGSVGRIGSEEERALARQLGATPTATAVPTTKPIEQPSPTSLGDLELNLNQFSRTASGEYEHNLSESVYDMFRIQPDMVTIWREKRMAMRSTYLAGPYELTKHFLETQVNGGKQTQVGILSISTETGSALLAMQKELTASVS